MSLARRLRVLLADDHALVLEGLTALVNGEADMTVVGSTTYGAKVLPLVDEVKPDVVLLDLELAGMNGADVLAALRRRSESPKVLVLTAYNDGESIRSALDAGADGLALKTESPQQALAAIRLVHTGQLVFPQAARRWLKHPGLSSGSGDVMDLTPRELAVWALVAEGLSNPEVADRLKLSDNTVKFHVQHLFEKLCVKNRTEAALKYAARHGPRR